MFSKTLGIFKKNINCFTNLNNYVISKRLIVNTATLGQDGKVENKKIKQKFIICKFVHRNSSRGYHYCRQG